MLSNDTRHREQLGLRIGQVGRLWRAEVDRRLSPHGLTESRWRLLLALFRAERPLRQKELAEILGIQGPTLVRSIDRLETEGLVERRATAGDRRARTIHLTERAEPSLVRIQDVVDSVREDLFRGVSPADTETCLAVLDRMTHNLGGTCASQPDTDNPDD